MIKHIVVTQENIDEGKPHKAHDCPLACALRDAGFDDAIVFFESAYVDLPRRMSVACDLPLVAQEFREAFDRGQPVSPIQFDIEVRA